MRSDVAPDLRPSAIAHLKSVPGVRSVLGETVLAKASIVLLPWLLGPALDLSAFTDGFVPRVRVDLRVTLLLGGALIAVVAIAAVIEAIVGRGRRLAGVLRFGGEG